MKGKIRVRGRDGAIRDVSDGYVLRDGEARIVELPFMDASGRTIIHDGNGRPAGQRPGFLYSDGNEQAEQARIDAYAEYDETIRERWRQRRDQPSNQRQSEPQSFDSMEAALAAAYADYERRICERWRK